jgi:tetratricopeptide (TPR) repeat protein
MRSRQIVALAFSVLLTGQGFLDAEAARKYYPPGYTPAGQSAAPAVQPEAQAQPNSTQVIIKTVPVIKAVPAKAKDPLQVLLDERRFYDALRLADTRLKKSPGNFWLQMTRGNILREQGNFGQAISQYQAVYDKHKTKSARAEAQNALGWTYYRLANEERQSGNAGGYAANIQLAERSFHQATQLAPGLVFPWAGLAQVALTNGRIDEAEKMVKKAQRISPGNLLVQLAYSSLLLAKDKPEDALSILYGIKKTTTHEPEVYLLLAKASLATGKNDDAIINLKQMLELVPEHVEGLRLLSQSYERKMKPEDAEATLEKAIALNPGDEKSVEALLKIYDQRAEQQRGILLLKTLLRDRPGQIAYAKALMERLVSVGRWDEAYEDGHAFMSNIQAELGTSGAGYAFGPAGEAAKESVPDLDQDTLLAVVSLFTRITYQQGKGLVDRQGLLQDSVVQGLLDFSMNRLHEHSKAGGPDLASRLNLLLLDPLVQLPPLPADFHPSEAELGTAIQIAFLEGDRALYDQLLEALQSSNIRLDTARRLYEIGDYWGAGAIVGQVLKVEPDSAEAQELQQKVMAARQELRDHLNTLVLLPRGISDSYWEKAASELLKLGSGNWETHALLADVLEKRRQPGLALAHQKLAAQYAPTSKERARWRKKAERTAHNLARTTTR